MTTPNKRIALMLVLPMALAITACTGPDGRPLFDDRVVAAGLGGAGGAAIGCVIADGTGGKCKDGAAAGGVLGAIGGVLLGQKTHEERQQQSGEYASLQSRIAGHNTRLADLTRNANDLAQGIEQRQNSVARLVQQARQGQVHQHVVQSQLLSINRDIVSTHAMLERLNGERESLDQTLVTTGVTPADASALRAKRNELVATIHRLNRVEQKLMAQQTQLQKVSTT